MARTRWWSKTRGIPHDSYDSWAASLAAQPGRQVRVLAWATTPDGVAIASPSALSHGDSSGWRHLGWHEIERGGWDGETGQLAWTTYGGDQGSVALTEPGRLPEVFRERVSASIVLEKFVPILNGRGVLISGRRDLAEGDVKVIWNSSLGRGLTWQTEGVRAATDEAIASVRTEYDMG
jgi:hypothetical protein